MTAYLRGEKFSRSEMLWCKKEWVCCFFFFVVLRLPDVTAIGIRA